MGKTADALARIKSLAPQSTGSHCIFQPLKLRKDVPVSVKNVLGVTVKITNFTKSLPSNSCLFNILCEEMGKAHKAFLLTPQVQW